METTTDLLAMENVTFSYGKVRAVDHLSLTVPSGCVTGLIGPNGETVEVTVDTVGPGTYSYELRLARASQVHPASSCRVYGTFTTVRA